MLDHPLQRPCAIDRIITLVCQPLLGGIVYLQRNLAGCQTFGQLTQLDIHDTCHVFAFQAIKDHDLVQTVQELGAEMGPHRFHHLILGFRGIRPFGQLAECLRPKVRRQNDQRLLEVHRAALTIGQHPIVQNLQQHVKDIRMRLFDFVEQDHLIGLAPHRFGQNTAFVIADIARRGTDQTRDRVFLHELGHIDAHHRVFVVKQILGQRLGQLGFTHAGWPKEKEAAKWPVRIIQSGTRPTDRVGNSRHSLFLADHPFADLFFHLQQLFTLAFQHFGCRNTGPALDHLRDLLGTHRFFDHHIGFPLLGLFQLGFQRGNDRIRQLSCPCQIPLTLGDLQLGARLLQLLFQLANSRQLGALGLPLGGHLGGTLHQFGQLFFQLFKPVLAGGVVLFLQGLGLDLLLHDLAVQRIQFFGLAVHFHTQARCGLVHQVDRLVRQEPVGDITMAKRCRCHKGSIGNPYTVV